MLSSTILAIHLYRLVVARSEFDPALFFVFLTLGVVALLLLIKGLFEARVDAEKDIRLKSEGK